MGQPFPANSTNLAWKVHNLESGPWINKPLCLLIGGGPLQKWSESPLKPGTRPRFIRSDAPIQECRKEKTNSWDSVVSGPHSCPTFLVEGVGEQVHILPVLRGLLSLLGLLALLSLVSDRSGVVSGGSVRLDLKKKQEKPNPGVHPV